MSKATEIKKENTSELNNQTEKKPISRLKQPIQPAPSNMAPLFMKTIQNNQNSQNKLYNIQPKQENTDQKPSEISKRKREEEIAAGKEKGLRHFSSKVCEKVQEKGKTTYSEVANELVQEFAEEVKDETNADEKNIRRRVYDALNVLMALDIISKDRKKGIIWKGLPSNLVENENKIVTKK